jgi:hypothetical protein
MYVRSVIAVVVIIGWSAVQPARAELSTSEALARYRHGDRDIRIVLSSFALAFSWANGDLRYYKQRQLFCPPPTLAITVEQNVNIIERHLLTMPSDADFPIGQVLLAALKEALPCPRMPAD